MTKVAILTPVLVDGDAIGNEVVEMYKVLNRAGFQAEIFAEHWLVTDTPVQHERTLGDFLGDGDIFIYHYSIGWDRGLQLLRDLKCRKIIRYHNVTPPEFFENISVAYTEVCHAGREQLKQLIKIQDVAYLCDSEYNLHDLNTIGINTEVNSVMPLFHRIEDLRSLPSDLDVVDRFSDGSFNILMVGRIAPNKGYSALIDAFNIYHKLYNPDSRLLLVGKQDERLETYNHFLSQKIEEFGLEESVLFTGGVSLAALKAYYLVADTFMITSEHEGFCVPLVEAMSYKIPIVAYGSTAIPYTVGDAGLVWEQADPYLLAGSLHKIATTPSIKTQLGEMGWKRYQTIFTNETTEKQFLQFLNSQI